jgi:hypothetical protein
MRMKGCFRRNPSSAIIDPCCLWCDCRDAAEQQICRRAADLNGGLSAPAIRSDNDFTPESAKYSGGLLASFPIGVEHDLTGIREKRALTSALGKQKTTAASEARNWPVERPSVERRQTRLPPA